FTSKKDLYLYLIDHCMEIIEEQYFNEIDTGEGDLFKRFTDMTKQKMRFLQTYPSAMNFMAKLLIQDVAVFSEELKKRIENLQQKGYDMMYRNLDNSLFRDDLDAHKAMRLIQWTFHGYEEALKYRLRHEDVDMSTLDYQPYFDEFIDYLDVMKTAFYTKEG